MPPSICADNTRVPATVSCFSSCLGPLLSALTPSLLHTAAPVIFVNGTLALKGMQWVILVLAMKSQLLLDSRPFPLWSLHHCTPVHYFLLLDHAEAILRLCLPLLPAPCRPNPAILPCHSCPSMMTFTQPWKRFDLNSPALLVWLMDFLHSTRLCWEFLLSDLFVCYCLLLALLPCHSNMNSPWPQYWPASCLWKAFVEG